MGAKKSKFEKIEIFERIINLIEEGKSLRWSLKEVDISSRTFYDWIDADEDMTHQYARAVSIRADLLFDELLEIADTPKEGKTTTITDKGVRTTEGDMIQHRRLQVDTRKWALSKMLPKKYGERLGLDHTGQPVVVPILEGGKELPNDFENDDELLQ